jgi:hypothetical protein
MMLFSLKWSLWVFMKVVQCMVKMWWKVGVFAMAYLDDFCVLVRTAEELLDICNNIIVPLLDKLGWLCKPMKGCWELMQTAEVLGLIVDLKDGVF